MGAINNGGAQAIKGFNYQKSVIALIAVLHYLDEEQTDIYVESEDDIVVKTPKRATYIQSKSTELTLSSIVSRKDDKDSILEKNLQSGSEAGSRYKLVTPRFNSHDKHLTKKTADIFTEGAEVYTYTKTAKDNLRKKIPSLPENKLDESRVVLTSFPAKQSDALTHIKGVMSNKNIPVDNSYGAASLAELGLRIDQKSEIIAITSDDYENKKITQKDLQRIFGHSYKSKHYEDILNALGCTIMKKTELMKKHFTVGAIYSSQIDAAVQKINEMDDINDINEQTIIDRLLSTVLFTANVDTLDKEAVVISALSQVIFERSQAC